MLVALFLLSGCGLAVFGVAAMRNPMLLAVSRRFEGYYQRMVLDSWHRTRLRLQGMVISFFGLVMVTFGLNKLVPFPVLDALANRFLLLLGLSFIGAFSFGIVFIIVLLIQGRAGEWSLMFWRRIDLAPINGFQTITPRMSRERQAFTLVYCLLVAFAVVTGLVIR